MRNLRNALTIYPEANSEFSKQAPAPIHLYKENSDWFGMPRGFYRKNQRMRHDEVVMVSDGGKMGDFATKMKCEGPYEEQGRAIDQMLAYTESYDWGGFLLRAGCGFGKCVREDTLIATPSGLARIGDVVNVDLDDESHPCSDTVIGPDGARRSVSHMYAKRSAPCLRLETESGFELSGTHVHPVKVLRAGEFAWVKMRDVRVGDVLVYRRGWIREDAHSVNADDFYFAGMLAGDGSCTQRTVKFTSEDEELRSAFVRICAKHGYTCTERGRHDITVDRGRGLFQRFSDAGLLDASNAHGKVVPRSVMSSGRMGIRLFLRGYFDTDGTVNGATSIVSATSVSRELLSGVQLLLLGLGVRSSLRLKRGRYKGQPHFSWRLMVYREDLGAFSREVGFGLTRKQNALDACERGGINPNKWLIPVGPSMSRFFLESGAGGRARWGNYTNQGCSASPAKVREFVEEYGLVEDPFWSSLLDDGFVFERVTSVDDDGEHRVCDLTVPDGHAYVAAGCVVHNTNVALEFARRLKKRTLILVHKEFFLRQWRERIEEFMPDAKVGIIRQDRCDYAGCDYVIGMLQSLARDDGNGSRYPREVYDAFGLIVSDETHRIGAQTWADITPRFKARYRLGLTATPRRKDGAENVFFYHIGDILYSAQTSAIVPALRKLKTTTKMKPVRGRRGMVAEDKLNHTQIVSQLVGDSLRNRQIADEVASAVAKGRKVMVVSERLNHLQKLTDELSSVLIRMDLPFDPVIDYYTGEWYSGGLDKKGKRRKRTRTEGDLRKAERANVVMATKQMIEEGLDIPAIDVLVLATPIGDAEQAVGRVRRHCKPSESKCPHLCPWRAGECEGKPHPVVVDVVDEGVPRLVRRFRRRLGFYHEIGTVTR